MSSTESPQQEIAALRQRVTELETALSWARSRVYHQDSDSAIPAVEQTLERKSGGPSFGMQALQ